MVNANTTSQTSKDGTTKRWVEVGIPEPIRVCLDILHPSAIVRRPIDVEVEFKVLIGFL